MRTVIPRRVHPITIVAFCRTGTGYVRYMDRFWRVVMVGRDAIVADLVL